MCQDSQIHTTAYVFGITAVTFNLKDYTTPGIDDGLMSDFSAVNTAMCIRTMR